MAKICPFMTTPEVPVECMGDACQVWDNIFKRCGTNTSDVALHIHRSHWHKRAHVCDTLGPECGLPTFAETITPTMILVQEFLSNVDLDGNKMIYGMHFKIDDNDLNKPYILRQLERQPNFIEHSEMQKITWKKYLNGCEMEAFFSEYNGPIVYILTVKSFPVDGDGVKGINEMIASNTVIISPFNGTGMYDYGIDITLTSNPPPGYSFVKWECYIDENHNSDFIFNEDFLTNQNYDEPQTEESPIVKFEIFKNIEIHALFLDETSGG